MHSHLSDIIVYPIKSTAGLHLSRATISRFGLEFDRRFVLCTTEGKFLTARTRPQLLHIRVSLTARGLIISAPGQTDLQLKYHEFSSHYQTVSVWQDHIEAQHCSGIADSWFSDYLGQECRLLFFGTDSNRPLEDFPQHQTAFADGYPLLLISQASLADLSSRCSNPVQMNQMRPNLVVHGTAAYEEDRWKKIRIGTAEFAIVKPCGRCILTTTNPTTLERNPDREPLSVLKRYRKGSDGEAHFGQNMIPLNNGIISVNDPVEILEIGQSEKYRLDLKYRSE